MADLDLVGEMSLEQLENNVEELYGKDRANELVYFLRHNSIDSSMQNKLYAAIFNNIKAQNSIDDILKNPSKLSHIINSIEKQITEYQIKQSNDINITSSNNTNLLNNKEFMESPVDYLKNLPQEELLSTLESILSDIDMPEETVKKGVKLLSGIINDDENSQIAIEEYLKKSGHKFKPGRKKEIIEKLLLYEEIMKSNPNLGEQEVLSILKENYKNFNKTFTQDDIDEFYIVSQIHNDGIDKFFEDAYAFLDKIDNKKIDFNKIEDINTRYLVDNTIFTYNSDEYLETLSPQDREAVLSELNKLEQSNTFGNTSNFEMHENLDLDSIENIFDAQFYEAKDPAENQTEFEYGDLDTIFDDFADTNAMQFDFTDQEPIVETPPTCYSPAEFIQQEMQKQAEEAEKIGYEISEQADLAQDTDKENNYMLEVEEKKGFFSSIKDRFSKFMQKITQKSLPDPNATRAQTTNQSFEAFERKTSIMSTIRSIGDRVTSAVKNISSLNKQNQTPEIKNTATIVGAQKANSQAMEMDNNPTDTNKKSEIIRPKAVQSRPKTNELSSFDQFVKVSNEGNRIEAAAKRDAKGSHNSQDRQQAVVEGSEATSRDDD